MTDFSVFPLFCIIVQCFVAASMANKVVHISQVTVTVKVKVKA